MIACYSYDDSWEIINRIFTADTPLVKSQYFDLTKATRHRHMPEVKLWLDILHLTYLDWLEHAQKPTNHTLRYVQEIQQWAYRKSFTMDRIGEALFLAYGIQPEIFAVKFRRWLRDNRTAKATPFTTFDLDTPFEVILTESVPDLTEYSSTGENDVYYSRQFAQARSQVPNQIRL